MIARSFVKRHPVLTFFALALAVSWASLVTMVGPDGFPGTTQEVEQLGGFIGVPMLLGPTVAGIVCIGMVDGRAGFHQFRVRLFRWRLGLRWYALALLALPALALATMLPLSLVWSDLRPEVLVTDDDKLVFVLVGIASGLMVGLFEEIGWTGFAIPKLRQRHGVLVTGLIVGFLWGVWHLPLFVVTSGDANGALDGSLLGASAVFCLVVLPVARVLMVWAFDRTDSLLLSIFLHASLTGVVASTMIPLVVEALPLVVWYLAFAGATALLTAGLMLHRSPTDTRRTRQAPPALTSVG